MSSPIITKNLHGKIHPEAAQVIELLGKGLKDAHDAIVSLKSQIDGHAATLATVSATATAASTAATAANSQLAQPVAAGQTNIQTADYATQQADHLGTVVLQTGVSNVTLNNLVTPPWTTKLINQTGSPITLAPSTSGATITGTNGTPVSSYTLNANSALSVYFDGLNYTVA